MKSLLRDKNEELSQKEKIIADFENKVRQLEEKELEHRKEIEKLRPLER